ncbi:MAG: hypothetical protein RLY49_516 [Candidatus Parcubacteria bacterium]|jgi:hypothetical protein
MADNSTKANFIAKALFIAGGIILFIVLVIFIFKMVPVAISNLKNLGSGIKGAISGEQIKVTPESDTVEVKSPLTVAFEYNPEKDGQYYVTYNCVDGLFFDIQSQDGPKRIICETPLKLGTNLNTISLVPIFTSSTNFADSKISILYKDENGNTIAKGSSIVTIKGEGEITSATSTQKNPYNADGSLSGSTVTTKALPETKPTVSNTSPSTSYSRPTKDLAITYATAIDSNSMFVIYVYNLGNTATGNWYFSYTDAENPSKVLLSPTQVSLAPGQGLAITVGFDGQENSKQTIKIKADPYNSISESNESNNEASIVITGNNSNSNNNDSYNSKDDADLEITSMEVGRISGNRFVEDNEIKDNDTAAVRFVVKNIGGESTGTWKFEITNLPYDDNGDSYRSKTYSSLRPGQSLEVIADFDGIDEGRYNIRVEVDSDDDVDEERENNNTESETLEVNN